MSNPTERPSLELSSNEKKIDKTNKVIVSAASCIPVVGSPISAIIKETMPEYRANRQDKFIMYLDENLTELKKCVDEQDEKNHSFGSRRNHIVL